MREKGGEKKKRHQNAPLKRDKRIAEEGGWGPAPKGKKKNCELRGEGWRNASSLTREEKEKRQLEGKALRNQIGGKKRKEEGGGAAVSR